MPAKKKIKPVERIMPKINLIVPGITYDELEPKDCFIMDGDLFIKCDEEQDAVSLSTGILEHELCEIVVLPVDVTITWGLKKEE